MTWHRTLPVPQSGLAGSWHYLPRVDGTIFGIRNGRNGPSKAGELVVSEIRGPRAASFVPAAPKHLPIASGCLSIFGYFPLSLFGAEGLRIQGSGCFLRSGRTQNLGPSREPSITLPKLTPEILEPRRRQFCVADSVLDAAVTKVSLKRSGVVSLIRERVAAGVPEHVRMGLQPDLGFRPCSLDHPGEAGGGKCQT